MYMLSALSLYPLLACSGGKCGDLEVASNANMNLALEQDDGRDTSRTDVHRNFKK